MAARRDLATTAGVGTPSRTRAAGTTKPTGRPRRTRLVQDDTGWLAAKHARFDAQMLDLVSRLSA